MTNWTGGTVPPVQHGLDQPTTVPIDLARLRTASMDRSLIREMKEAERPRSGPSFHFDDGGRHPPARRIHTAVVPSESYHNGDEHSTGMILEENNELEEPCQES